MDRYNPDQSIDPEEWMALDEGEQQHLVEQYHRIEGIEIPNSRAHAAIHVIVETQIALGNELPAQKALERLMEEGLARHDAIHAIGSVLSEHLFGMIKDGAREPGATERYYHQLEELTVERWVNNYGADPDEEEENNAE